MKQPGAFFWKVEKIVSKGDYNYAVVKDHPSATKNGYVLHHRIVMENYLGRFLNSNEVVHHINGIKKDNRIENLEVHDLAQHVRSHGLQRGRTMVTLKCPSCGEIFIRMRNKTHLVRPTNWTACSNSCRGKFSRKIQLQGRTKEVENAISVNILSEYKYYPEDNTEVTHLQEEP